MTKWGTSKPYVNALAEVNKQILRNATAEQVIEARLASDLYEVFDKYIKSNRLESGELIVSLTSQTTFAVLAALVKNYVDEEIMLGTHDLQKVPLGLFIGSCKDLCSLREIFMKSSDEDPKILARFLIDCLLESLKEDEVHPHADT